MSLQHTHKCSVYNPFIPVISRPSNPLRSLFLHFQTSLYSASANFFSRRPHFFKTLSLPPNLPILAVSHSSNLPLVQNNNIKNHLDCNLQLKFVPPTSITLSNSYTSLSVLDLSPTIYYFLSNPSKQLS